MEEEQEELFNILGNLKVTIKLNLVFRREKKKSLVNQRLKISSAEKHHTDYIEQGQFFKLKFVLFIAIVEELGRSRALLLLLCFQVASASDKH